MMKNNFLRIFRIESIAFMVLLLLICIMAFPHFFMKNDTKQISMYVTQISKMLKLAESISDQEQITVYAVMEVDDFGKGFIILTSNISDRDCLYHHNCLINGYEYAVNLQGLNNQVKIEAENGSQPYVVFPNKHNDNLMEITYENHKIFLYKTGTSTNIFACSNTLKGVFTPCGYTVINKRV